MKTLFVLVFLSCFSVGFGLKCYKCNSGKSWDDCAAIKEEDTCTSAQDRCGKVHIDGKKGSSSTALYLKGCTTSAVCKAADGGNCKVFVGSDPSIVINKCDPTCCTGDLCNGAKVPMISAITLLACALVALFR